MGAHAGRTLQVAVADNRELQVAVYGPADGVPLVVHHGTPGAAGVFAPLVEVGAERGLCHVAYSRPGYAGSGRDPGRSVASCAADVAAIADTLGCERFYSIGGSGGGPHSIACAALLADRVISAAAIASVAPADAEGLDWTAGMGKENVSEFAAAGAGDAELEQFLEAQAQEMRSASGAQIIEVLGDLVCEPDREALSGALGEYLAREFAQSVADGVWGWFDDDRALLGDWGFDLADIGAPLSLWHGGQDRFVPVAHGEWLAAHVRGDAHLRPEHGHLSLTVSSYGEILNEMLARGAPRR